MKLLETEVQARERAGGNTTTLQVPRRNPKSHPLATAATLVAGSADEKLACYFCGQPHYSKECSVVTSIDERRRILLQNSRCYVCLRKGHIVRNCRSSTDVALATVVTTAVCQNAVSRLSTSQSVVTPKNSPSTTTRVSAQLNPTAFSSTCTHQ